MDNENSNEDDALEEPSDDGASEEHPLPLCPNCLTPCSPKDYYCPHCGSNDPINPLASYMPFVRLRFTIGFIGCLWKKVVDSKKNVFKALFYLLVIILLLLFFRF